jgi:hypothetical protein
MWKNNGGATRIQDIHWPTTLQRTADLAKQAKSIYDIIKRDDETESDLAILPIITTGLSIYNALKKKDEVESDLSLSGIVKGVKTGVSIYNAIKKDDEEESDFEIESDLKINWDKVLGYVSKGIDIYKQVKGADAELEADAELFGKTFKNIVSKVAPIAKEIGKKYIASKTGIQLSDSMDAYGDVRAAGISISSSGNCHNRNVRSCTSLDGARGNTINGVITLKRSSGCPITITGGTEIGHAGGTYSHGNGYKVDIALNSCIDSYVTRNFASIGRRGDGAAQYKSSAGNIYAREGNHWDITYF